MTHPPIRSYVLRQGRFSPRPAARLRRAAAALRRPVSRPQPLDFARFSGARRRWWWRSARAWARPRRASPREHPGTDYLAIEVHAPGVGQPAQAGGRSRRSPTCASSSTTRWRCCATWSRPARSPASTSSSPIRGRRSATTSAACCSRRSRALLASRLAPGGYLHVATDWQEYAEHVLAGALARRTASPTPRTDSRRGPAARPETKFERRGLKLGHGVWDIVLHGGHDMNDESRKRRQLLRASSSAARWAPRA